MRVPIFELIYLGLVVLESSDVVVARVVCQSVKHWGRKDEH